MRAFADAPAAQLARIRLILTDVDDTLTCHGRLSASTYAGLERLRDCGVSVVPVTAAPAGWCEHMALMWPVAGVIAENGGLSLKRVGPKVERQYWHPPLLRDQIGSTLADLARDLCRRFPGLRMIRISG